MPETTRRERNSGSVRKLPSGRWQARVLGEDGVHVSLGSLATKTDASNALKGAGADQIRGIWVDPRAGRITFEAYAADWLANRTIPHA